MQNYVIYHLIKTNMVKYKVGKKGKEKIQICISS